MCGVAGPVHKELNLFLQNILSFFIKKFLQFAIAVSINSISQVGIKAVASRLQFVHAYVDRAVRWIFNICGRIFTVNNFATFLDFWDSPSILLVSDHLL